MIEVKLGLITKISSTYIRMKTNAVDVILKKRDVSVFESVNPRESKYVESFLNHSLGACFKPDKDLLSLQILLE